MAIVCVGHKVPEGDFCTVITEGELFTNYEHCTFRSATYASDDEKTFLVYCNLFGQIVQQIAREEMPSNALPRKCPTCLKASRKEI